MTEPGSLSVLAFENAALQRDLDRLRKELAELRKEVVRHDLWEVAQGSNRVDIGRLETEIQALERALDAAKVVAEGQHEKLSVRIDALKRDIETNFRKGVILVFTSILAPLIVGGIVVVFQLLGRAP